MRIIIISDIYAISVSEVMDIKTVKDLRQENGITPPQMAKKLGVALSTYFDKEADRRKFTPSEIVTICTTFKVRVEDVKNFYAHNPRNADDSEDETEDETRPA